MAQTVPQAVIGLIGGSSTNSLRFPHDLAAPDIEVLREGLVFATPWGDSPSFTLFTLGLHRVLTCRMHGWRQGTTRGDASRQVFWVFQQAGVHKVVAEGGVGSVSPLLDLRDLVIPTDYLDFSVRKDVGLGGPYLGMMRQPTCPQLRQALLDVAQAGAWERRDRRVFARTTYAVTDGRHFESVAEVQMLRQAGADVVGQSMVPEVYLAREIGACYARVDMVVNYGEGVVREWKHEILSSIFYGEAKIIGGIVLDALRRIDPEHTACGCRDLRRPTLLREPDQEQEE
ncbi:MAG: MTAP family purine nucleoside phosphorylase [Symbiobacteriia bacterium]